MAVYRKRQKNSCPVPATDVLASVLAGLGAAPGQGEERERLRQLWLNWSMVMGPELAPLARPLGHHHDLLLIGAEDAMLAQELHLMADELLERVNAFMERPFFSAVKVSLQMGKPGLDKAAKPQNACGAPGVGSLPRLERARARGAFLEAMDPASPVARAYARFVRQWP